LTTAILGVVLTASIVAAQQSGSADGDGRTRAPAISAPAAPEPATADPASQLYGASASRGARYLLRNGLDYLSYQEYERSLKFLREAERRKKELNDSEREVLKQGIESAQRGLRNATDAETPYAISDRSRPRNGFTPATPETRLAGSAKQSRSKQRRLQPIAPLESDDANRDGDGLPGPIRLTGAEEPLVAAPADTVVQAQPASVADPGQFANSRPRPRALPEIPPTATVAQLPDLTEANGSGRVIGAPDTSEPVPSKPLPTPSRVASMRSQAPAADSQPPAVVTTAVTEDVVLAGSPAQPGLSSLPPSPTTTSDKPQPALGAAPDPGPALVAPAAAANPAETAPAPPGDSTALPTLTSPGEPAISVAPSAPKVKSPETAPAPVMADPTTVQASASAPALEPMPTVDPTTVAHQETEEVVPASTPASTTEPAPAQPAPAATPLPASPSAGDDLPPLPSDLGQPAPAPPPTDQPAKPSTSASPGSRTGAGDDELPPLPTDLGQSAPTIGKPPVTSDPLPPAGNASAQPVSPAESAAPVVEKEVSAPPAVEIPSGGTAVETGTPASAPGTAPAPAASPAPVAAGGAAGDDVTPSAPVVAPEPVASPPAPVSAPGATEPSAASGAPAAETGTDGSSLPAAIVEKPVATATDSFIPEIAKPSTTLRPDLLREVEKIARNQEDELRRQVQAPQQPPVGQPRDTMGSDLRTQTQLDISRAPSPAEARPIKAIPVPEDWVPLPPRNWTPQRKYWAAAATCHLPLYFQDPVLERYGHSVEQFVGPIGRFLTYPLDDPTQSSQRNQMLQPFFSAGLMGLQIIAWPYNLIMDPPWEAQYDLGYYRPGDNIPTDLYWLPLHGYGPPLRGSNY
jgi:hypothetical protein